MASTAESAATSSAVVRCDYDVGDMTRGYASLQSLPASFDTRRDKEARRDMTLHASHTECTFSAHPFVSGRLLRS